MPLQTQTSSEFFTKITEIVNKTKLSYMDAILHYCDQNGMEPDCGPVGQYQTQGPDKGRS